MRKWDPLSRHFRDTGRRGGIVTFFFMEGIMSRTDASDYDALENTIQSIPDDRTETPAMPVDTYVAEADHLYIWVQADKPLFLKANFDWTIVESLSQKIGALRYAESKWTTSRLSQKEASRTFLRKKKQADLLRHEILAAMDYAFFCNSDLLKAVQAIREGATNADLIMDLTAVAELGFREHVLLEKINFNMDKLHAIARLTKELAGLLAESTSEKMLNSAERVIRDKAYTLLRKSVDHIRRCGKYVCRNNEQRLKGYFSRYYHTLYRRRQGHEEAPPENQTSSTPAPTIK